MKFISSSRQYSLAPPQPLIACALEDEMEAVDTEGGNVEKEESLNGKGGLTNTGVGW